MGVSQLLGARAQAASMVGLYTNNPKCLNSLSSSIEKESKLSIKN